MSEIELLLQKANRSFESSEETLASGHFDFAMSRAYYGCF
ncbi:MAG TPA: HEPN domain-containing protein [Thermoanaerobaculia bacterium]|nr:HEPN domain-containing protein [Thermoanaerobaculia bacterium]